MASKKDVGNDEELKEEDIPKPEFDILDIQESERRLRKMPFAEAVKLEPKQANRTAAEWNEMTKLKTKKEGEFGMVYQGLANEWDSGSTTRYSIDDKYSFSTYWNDKYNSPFLNSASIGVSTRYTVMMHRLFNDRKADKVVDALLTRDFSFFGANDSVYAHLLEFIVSVMEDFRKRGAVSLFVGALNMIKDGELQYDKLGTVFKFALESKGQQSGRAQAIQLRDYFANSTKKGETPITLDKVNKKLIKQNYIAVDHWGGYDSDGAGNKADRDAKRK